MLDLPFILLAKRLKLQNTGTQTLNTWYKYEIIIANFNTLLWRFCYEMLLLFAIYYYQIGIRLYVFSDPPIGRPARWSNR